MIKKIEIYIHMEIIISLLMREIQNILKYIDI